MVRILGKVIIKSNIYVKTGIRIGGPTEGLKIGGIDNPVIKDAYGKPYIPGSSLKGKLRSLTEIKEGKPLDDESGIHRCSNPQDYNQCVVCKIYGVMDLKSDGSTPILTRLIVRDTYLDEKSITEEMKDNLEFPWTEIKTEINIDRRTGTVSKVGGLRTPERVPAGAIFKDCEMIFNIYEEGDKDLLKKLFEAMLWLEDDYLGGMGSRGYGKVKFKDIEIYWNKASDYETGKTALTPERKINNNWDTPAKLIENFDEIKKKLL
ncbi:MAG: type III-A CRISPR-associated RAMP protein Csm3 [candidate division WOR-3 bacterium]|uniref:CRISPR system Cms endoribonuclease Csm3 n=1 Tax=candidate division WOR-3 bacterium TaxID=2052148 RepID=A0A7C4W7H3_UNCW3